jgi:glycosyltransferase involved in cell wall biosynthesis
VALQAGRRGNASEAIAAAVAATGVGHRVRFLGHRDDVPDVVAAADVFVFPSRYEGLGGSLLEAMALGVPVVASDVPAIREIVGAGPAGILVPVDDVDAWASAVRSLLDDPAQRAALGARGRELFDERFTLDAVADRFAAALRSFVP